MYTTDLVELLHKKHTVPYLLKLLADCETAKAKGMSTRHADYHHKAAQLLKESAAKLDKMEHAVYFGETEEPASVLAMACNTTKPLGSE
jgi:hypothetical protein